MRYLAGITVLAGCVALAVLLVLLFSPVLPSPYWQ